jgi:hypothetical protein
VRASATSFPLSKHTGGGDTAPAFSGLRVCLQLTWEVGLPPSPVEFSSLCHSHKLSHSWLLGVTPVGASPVRPGLFIYSSGKDSPSLLFGIQCAPPSLQRVFIVLIAYYSVSLFSLGWAWSFQGAVLFLPRAVCGSTVYRLAHLSASSQAVWVWATGGPGALLVSPFSMKWRFSAQAGGVEGSKFCLFLVVLPARCVSSISPRFHYRRHAFCFLLAAIL